MVQNIPPGTNVNQSWAFSLLVTMKNGIRRPPETVVIGCFLKRIQSKVLCKMKKYQQKY